VHDTHGPLEQRVEVLEQCEWRHDRVAPEYKAPPEDACGVAPVKEACTCGAGNDYSLDHEGDCPMSIPF